LLHLTNEEEYLTDEFISLEIENPKLLGYSISI
jgi:hypothetical protein